MWSGNDIVARNLPETSREQPETQAVKSQFIVEYLCTELLVTGSPLLTWFFETMKRNVSAENCFVRGVI